jgi:O-antigen ligase
MSASAAASPLVPVWRWFRNPAFWMPAADVFAVLTALSLPWSTSLVSIFGACWLGAAALPYDFRNFLQFLKHPMCYLPLVLFALAAIGTLWSDVPWHERLHAVGPALKFLLIPVLLFHFRHSSRGMWVFVAFLVSCVPLMLMSWITAFDPAFTLKPAAERVCGVFVKNYIDQSQEFAICAVALAYPVITLLKENRRWLAGLFVAVALSFIANMVFVIASRTALATMPIMLAVFALRHLQWRGIVAMLVVMTIAGLAWAVTPRMCRTVETLSRDFELYEERNIPTSAGLRIEFWTKSLHFIREAPVIGHGTGSIRALFARAATGDAVDASGHVVANPHNQTLSVAIQWGVVGVILLYAMWLFHLLLFVRADGPAGWIGLLVVVQNILSSLFNSHLFDFHEGWMYVLGVGVAGGMVLKGKAGAGADGSVKT